MPVGLARLEPPAFHLVLPLAGARLEGVGMDFRCWPGRLHFEVWEMPLSASSVVVQLLFSGTRSGKRNAGICCGLW